MEFKIKIPSIHMTQKSFLSLFISFCMVFALVSSIWVKPVHAKTVRIAVVSSIFGDVTVKKGGGSKTYEAYEDMSLNEGDTIYTGDSSGATLTLSEGDGEVTVGANAEMSVSDLSSSDSGKKSKLKIWAGSLWVKVKSLASSDDEFEVETPTAVMGVRGTEFYVGVDPLKGKTTMFVAAGKVSATTVTNDENNQQFKKVAYLYPTQQINLDSRDEVSDPNLKVEFVNINDIVDQASANVIEAMIKNKAEIDKENDEFLKKNKELLEQGKVNQTDGSFIIRSMDELDKVSRNFDNLIGNIAKQAVATKKIEQATMNNIIDEANKKIEKQERKLDLGNVKKLDKTAGTDPEKEKAKLEALKKEAAKKLLEKAATAKKREEVIKQLEKFIEQVAKTNSSNTEANSQAQADQAEQAEVVFKSNNPPEIVEQYEEAKNNSAPTTPSTPSTSGSNNSGSNNGGNNGSTDTTSPSVTLEKMADPDHPSNPSYFNLNVNMSNFTGNQSIYAVELHLMYYSGSADASGIYVTDSTPVANHPNGKIFDDSSSAESIKEYEEYDQTSNLYKKELIYAVTNFGTSSDNISVSGTKTLVSIPFRAINYDDNNDIPAQIEVGYIKVIKKDGTVSYANLQVAPLTMTIGHGSNYKFSE
ncbi:FecR domain-containing protein [Paenibacillus hexagrammi]|uniref:FecR domain-containing protein n=1 Tax=Paenibacillus hexagrammi TaxID=2908839 RepID=A0ABY3SDV7_9BACL|nr:FecR domain-containing protein [Paenibacillus sp. YPD9-1]UJF31588.1 FecR domain-containing protein [Paenibacillus sp. YPD9-1]